MYKCALCNYLTDSKFNIERHEKTVKHKNRISGNEEIIIKSKYGCICGKEYKSSSGLWMHKNKYKCTKDEKKDKNDNKTYLIDIPQSTLNKIKSLNSNSNNQIVIINNTNNNIQNNQLINQITKLYPNAPELEKISNFNYLGNANSEEFIGNIIYHFNRNSLDRFFGDFILKHYKKKDLSKQSLYNTDVSRLNFLIKTLIENESIWRKDWKGINTQKIIIKPMLNYTDKLITKYIKIYSRRNFVSNIDMKNYGIVAVSFFMDIY